MHYFISDADTLFRLDTTGTVCRYTATGWVLAADVTPQALAGLAADRCERGGADSAGHHLRPSATAG